jgi:hypothetical protein
LRLTVALDWAADWEADQQDCLRALGQAVARRDFDAASIAVGQLNAVTDKRFTAMSNVLRVLAEDTPTGDC